MKHFFQEIFVRLVCIILIFFIYIDNIHDSILFNISENNIELEQCFSNLKQISKQYHSLDLRITNKSISNKTYQEQTEALDLKEKYNNNRIDFLLSKNEYFFKRLSLTFQDCFVFLLITGASFVIPVLLTDLLSFFS